MAGHFRNASRSSSTSPPTTTRPILPATQGTTSYAGSLWSDVLCTAFGSGLIEPHLADLLTVRLDCAPVPLQCLMPLPRHPARLFKTDLDIELAQAPSLTMSPACPMVLYDWSCIARIVTFSRRSNPPVKNFEQRCGQGGHRTRCSGRAPDFGSHRHKSALPSPRS